VTLPREEGPPPAPDYANVAGFVSDIRIVGFDTSSTLITEQSIRQILSASDGSLDFLALSGGGAGGSFGAGVLTGMTREGHRPRFEVVTGVSTGALIAPFAYLGPDWDDELREAFVGESAENILQNRGAGVFYSSSFFKGGPLDALVDAYVTDELIAAVAEEAETGRILMVATTNLDRQLTTYWDMGRIAKQKSPAARELFRDVLVASASVPGVFPPVMMDVEADGQLYQEMHVDGGASVPFFIGPEWLTLQTESLSDFKGANLYVLVNGQLQAPVSSTPVNTIQIVSKSFDTMMMFGARTALREYAVLSDTHDMNFKVAYIPPDLAFAGSLNFKTDERSRLYEYAQTCARRDLIWFRKDELTEALQNTNVLTEDLKEGFGIPKYCPTQIEESLQERERERMMDAAGQP
tara:strand:- start:24643 stop:25869 length:1227 start_codon:yes stop_codon:yes gene_type:complete